MQPTAYSTKRDVRVSSKLDRIPAAVHKVLSMEWLEPGHWQLDSGRGAPSLDVRPELLKQLCNFVCDPCDLSELLMVQYSPSMCFL